jgi:hypothetical protein
MGSFVNILEENGKIYILFFYNNEKNSGDLSWFK